MDSLERAFLLLHKFASDNAEASSPGLVVPSDLQKVFQEVALHKDLKEVFDAGARFGFAPASVTNILILHGAYFRLISELGMPRGANRLVDSLYHSTFPSLNYVVSNKDVLAPWVTLGAQEALLDMPLHEMSVIEYGSGISTFFFLREAFECVSFESDNDPAGKGEWSREMMDMAQKEKVDLRLVVPDGQNDSPVESLDLVSGSKVLVFIDGEDRDRHFEEWCEHMLSNRLQNVVLMVDNSEITGFQDSFELLYRHSAFMVHHYGSAYGQLTTKQCTSFVTLNSSLLVAKSPSPSAHDKRWGRMNMQP